MKYCSGCKNVTICKYISEVTDMEDKIEELKKINPRIYTITFKCNYFVQKTMNLRGTTDAVL